MVTLAPPLALVMHEAADLVVRWSVIIGNQGLCCNVCMRLNKPKQIQSSLLLNLQLKMSQVRVYKSSFVGQLDGGLCWFS